jgi:hypothetical protein
VALRALIVQIDTLVLLTPLTSTDVVALRATILSAITMAR